jgi:hypothetical protein
MIGITFLLFVSIAYAGVLSYYGKIVGNVNVKGPTFYLTNSPIGGIFYQLKTNTPPTDSEKGYVTFTDSESRKFVSDSLGVNSFYKPKFDIYLSSYASTENMKVNLYMEILDANRNYVGEICRIENVEIPTSETTLHLTCSGTSDLTLNSDYRFALKVEGLAGSGNYYIHADGISRIEVSKA